MTAKLEESGPVAHAGTADAIKSLRGLLNTAIRGKQEVVELVLACLLARGHLLLEDLPGLGKTTLARTLANALGGRYARVQCTPDLMPSDITGFNMFNQKTREFDFCEGPIFANVLLADEINRATPRTQSALFEAMAERQVTIDRATHRLPQTFFVVATQNPIDSHGTYPLPEAQLDRFAMKLSIGYPARATEIEILARHVGQRDQSSSSETAISSESLFELQEQIANIAVAEKVNRYLVDLAEATRRHPEVSIGLSPRGLLILQRVAQARAFLNSRRFVTPDDVQDVAGPVLSVRLAGDFSSPDSVIDAILADVPTPLWD
ncbi:MAG: MoxR family ATPase [Planctomycetota bacterium]|nr:MAG: MoxR family ATPase [Planctomycetota bacterium]